MNLSRVPGVYAYTIQRYPESPVAPVERTELSIPDRSPRFEMPRLYGQESANRSQAAGHMINLLA